MGQKQLRRLLVVVAGLATASLLLAGSASAAEQYADPTGDSGSAPDILGATVVSDNAGQMIFHLSVANLPSSGDTQTGLFIDSDANRSTGCASCGGVDYALVLDQSDRTWGFAHWSGSAWDWNTPDSTVLVLIVSDGFLISVNKSEVGNTGQINFWVLTMTAGGGDGKSDEAPADGLWNYDLQAGGPAIQDVQLQAKPAAPKAGKAFTLSVTGLSIPQTGARDALQPESSSCKATLAGRPIAGGGANGCTFKLNKKAKGKKLVVTVTVEYQGVTKTVTRTYKVK
jgi:hypothetical protein